MIINEALIASFKALGRNINGLDSIIEDAEIQLRTLFGNNFYQFLKSTDEPELMNGNNTQKGIKRLLVELFWIELLKSESYFVTASGVVHKLTENSVKISDSTRGRQIKKTRQNAFKIFKDIIAFIKEREKDYPLFNNDELVNIFKTSKTTLV